MQWFLKVGDLAYIYSLDLKANVTSATVMA